MYAKINVNGRNADPLFKYLRFNSNLRSGKIGWNFSKFLVDKSGSIVRYFGPGTSPLQIIPEIENIL